MFSAEVHGVDPLIAKLDRLSRQIELAKEEMPREFIDWQRTDMRRRYPTMQTGQTGNDTTVMTSIWPRSRQVVQRRQSATQPKRRAGPRMVGPRHHSMRPILRVELYDKLKARMTELIWKALKWP